MAEELLFVKDLSKNSKLIFAIRVEITNSGDKNYIPVCGSKPLLPFIPIQFTRILKVYDEYFLTDLDTKKILTKEEANQHIEEYRKQLWQSKKDEVRTVEIIKVT